MHKIEGKEISLERIWEILDTGGPIELSEGSRIDVVHCREFLEAELERRTKPVYGVNTGFGALYNTTISKEEISDLQSNLVLSHACGSGEVIPVGIVRIMLLLKIINLSLGHSGIRLETLERLIFLYNNEIFPVIYEQGSLGASGDLAPLAHLSLPLIHKGEVWIGDKIERSEHVLHDYGLEPLVLGAKEGLALLNGTQFMSAYGVYILGSMKRMNDRFNLTIAASLDAFDCSPDPFKKEIQEVRAHPGQIQVAEEIRSLLKDSEIANAEKEHVQDPYSFRCIPQVHGASYDAIHHAHKVIEREVQSVTDNPMVFPETGEIISAGNFHGQPLAITLDFLAIAIAELCSISERRVYKLISGQRGLPPFLSPNPGLNSGFMIPQYTAASMVSQNKQLCTPASVDTIDSSNGQEDHVSMGANSALKCLRVLKNFQKVLGIELMNASQALKFREPSKSSPQVEEMLSEFRALVPFAEQDEEFHIHMRMAARFIAH